MHSQEHYGFSRDVCMGCVGIMAVAAVMLVLIPLMLYWLTFNSMGMLF